MSQGRKETEQAILEAGGKFASSVSAKTAVVVIGDNPGDKKISKAKELGIEMIDEAEFLRRLGRDPMVLQRVKSAKPKPVAVKKKVVKKVDRGQGSLFS